MEQAVFDVPMVARQSKQGSGPAVIGRHRGDRVDNLLLAICLEFTASFDARDLHEAGPLRVEIGWQFGANRNHACFNTAMPGVGIFMPREIGRIDWRDALAGVAGQS